MKEAMQKLLDYAKGLKTWEEIVTASTGENYSYSIKENGTLVALMGDGDVTHYTAKSSIDNIETELSGLSVIERKIERVLYFFYEKVDKQMIESAKVSNLDTAKKEIEAEIARVGYIDDSDCTYYFRDLAQRVLGEDAEDSEIDELITEIREKIMCNYEGLSEIQADGHCGYVYTTQKFNSFDEFNKHFNLGE